MNERRPEEPMKSIRAISFAVLMFAAASEKAMDMPFAHCPPGSPKIT
jgi:hypothetical protein